MKSNPCIAAAVLAAATFVFSSSACALTVDQAKSITASIQKSKVVEVTAKATDLVEKASKEERNDVAAAVVAATAKNHPGALLSVVSAVVRKAPTTAEAVTKSALSVSPENADAIVAAVISAVPDQAASIAQYAGKMMPERAQSFQNQAVALGNTGAVANLAPAATSVGRTQRRKK